MDKMLDREMICPLFIIQNTVCCMVQWHLVHCAACVKLWKARNWNLYCSSFLCYCNYYRHLIEDKSLGIVEIVEKVVVWRRVFSFLFHGFAFVLTHAKFTVKAFFKRWITGEGCWGSSCELRCRPWARLIADLVTELYSICTFSTFSLGGHQCLDLHSFIIHLSIHFFCYNNSVS